MSAVTIGSHTSIPWHEEFFKRIPITHRASLQAKCDEALPLQPKELTALLTGCYPQIGSKELPYQIIDAIAKGALNEWQAASLLLETEVVKLQENRILTTYTCYNLTSKEGRDLVQQCANSVQFGPLSKWDETLVTFLEQTLKTENLVFFHLKRRMQKISFPAGQDRIYSWATARVLHSLEALPFFETIPYGEEYFPGILLFPPKLWDAVLRYHYKNQAINSNLVLGYSDKERLSDPTKRVISITGPFAPGPKLIHDLPGNSLELYFHDQYHLLLESANPHRALWVTLAQTLKKQPPSSTSHEQQSFLFQKLLDRELFYYLKEIPHNVAFWVNLGLVMDESPDDFLSVSLDLILSHQDFQDQTINFDSLQAANALLADPQTGPEYADPTKEKVFQLYEIALNKRVHQ